MKYCKSVSCSNANWKYLQMFVGFEHLSSVIGKYCNIACANITQSPGGSNLLIGYSIPIFVIIANDPQVLVD